MKRVFCLLAAAVLLLNMLSACEDTPVSTDGGTSAAEPSVMEELPAPTQATQQVTEPTVYVEPKAVILNEIMSDNEKLCLGHGYDWIELYNQEETAVDLDGFYLTDDLEEPHAMPLVGMQIPSEGYLVVTLDDSAAFGLSSNGESVYLVCGDAVISELTFAGSSDGESMDSSGICRYPTPGFANTEDGYLAYLAGQSLPELIISEAMSSNSKYLGVNGEYYDLVELKNNSDAPLSLQGYYLSDKRSEPQRYALPDVTLQPGEYFVIYCSGEMELGSNHTSFKLSADGETLYLSNGEGFVDVLTVPAQLQKNESYGRDGNVPVFLNTPTFGEDNSGGFLTGLAAPAASAASGMYDDAVTLTLTGEGEIYYTLDGSRPTKSSRRYSEPILIDGITTVRAFCVSGERSSAITSYTYAVGAEHDLPVVVVSIPRNRLSGDKGILNNIGQNFEYEAMLTLIEDGEEKFSVPCGFRLHGYGSRKCPKQNFQLRFRSEYGAGKLEYKLFEDLDIDSFNSLLLKGGSEDWFAAVMRDEVATAVVRDTNLYTQAMKPVVLYLGGEYWGVYYIRERFSDDYVASHMGVPEESVDIVESSSAMTQCGSNQDFLDLREYCQTHDMSTEENYAYLASKIDVLSLMDWYICRAYEGDRDLMNIRRFRSVESDGLWRWMYFDLDWAFYNTEAFFSTQIADYDADRTLMRAAIASQTGRDLFLKRCAELLDSVLNEEYINATIDTIVSQVDSEMTRDRQRWGYSYEKWQGYVQNIRDYVADDVRMKGFLQDLQKYFTLSDEEMESYFGGLF